MPLLTDVVRIDWKAMLPRDMFWGGLSLLVIVFIILSGCSGCETTQDGPCPETPCGATERCVQGQCISIFDVVCIPSCDDDQVCNQGKCVDVVETCTAPKQVCDPFKPISGDYYCVDWDGLTSGDVASCSKPCTSEGTCDEGEACFVLSGLNETPCQNQSQCGPGRLCISGACRAAACRPSECEGLIDGAQTCKRKYDNNPQFPNGATCYEPDGDDINQCVPAGLQSINEVCISVEDAVASNQFSFTCKLGLTCVQGRCLTPCKDDSPCAQGKTCLFAEEDVTGKGVGFCGVSCEPFQTGVCEGQNKCLPVKQDLGYCVPAGTRVAFETCAPNTFDCEDGTWCVTYDNGSSRCMPMCNVGVAPPEGETSVTQADQLKRDATCPQPSDPAQSYVSLQHFALGAGNVDLYLNRSNQPIAQDVQPGQIVMGNNQASPGFVVIPPGAHVLEVRPAGAPTINAPVVEVSFALNKDEARAIVLGDSRADQSDVAIGYVVELDQENPPGVMVLQSIPDMPTVDLVAYPAGTLDNAIELGTNVSPRRQTQATVVPTGQYDLYLWPVDDSRQDPQRALWVVQDLTLGQLTRQRVVLSGTRAVTDNIALKAFELGAASVPEAVLGPPRLTCSDLNNGVFGYCEQVCDGPRAYVNSVCSGEQMGCMPIQRDGFLGWESLCRPTGTKLANESCNPRIPFGECADGLYCLEYGNAAPDFNPAERGRCLPHCVVGDDDFEMLKCEQGQACQILDANFEIGRCGFPCDPSGNYTDATCPDGLASCKPRASATRESGGTGAPSVENLPPFCSASGLIEAGENCAGSDCVPGTECLYPRSAQNSLVSTLLSQYFGASGQTPTCTPQCDPFDGLLSLTRCGPEETCLVNFPWSANVGHCADIVEKVQPFQPCTRPGEACGDDSVCVVDGGAPFCLRLCQYIGGPSVDTYSRSTCPIGYQCRPLVNDVGFCQTG